ncbi:MAG TPA: hypothetical protein VGB49_09535 [Caulobacteraceae bacterium]|jgi:hypothetical protein
MKHGLLNGAAALAALALCAGAAQAQVAAAARQLFVSPAGEPFRARGDEPYPSAVWFAQADADHDGAIVPAEMTADAQRAFLLYDVDRDGRINGAEVQRYESEIVPEMLGHPYLGPPASRGPSVQPPAPPVRLNAGQMPGQGRGGGTSDRGPTNAQINRATRQPRPTANGLSGAGPFSFLNVAQPLRAADLDLSRSTTAEEFVTAAQRWFVRLDANADGRLLFEELPQTPVQRMGRRGR